MPLLNRNKKGENKGEDKGKGSSKVEDNKRAKTQKKKSFGKRKKKVSGDESVGSHPNQIGGSEEAGSPRSKQTAGQATGAARAPSGGDDMSVASAVMSVSSRYSSDPKTRQEEVDKKNASSKHNLGVFYFGKMDYDKAKEYLEVALQARINLYGKKDGRVLETQLAISDALTGQQKEEEAIELLKKVEATVKKLRRERDEKEDGDSDEDDSAEINRLLSDSKPIDLDKLYEQTQEKLEALGVKSNKFVRKGAADGQNAADMFGNDYKKMNKKQAKDLSDPDVFIRVMKTDDLTQDQIKEGMQGLCDEVPDLEIYVGDPFDEDFEEIPVAQQVRVIRELDLESSDEEEEEGEEDGDDDSSVDSAVEKARQKFLKTKEKDLKKQQKQEEKKEADIIEETIGATLGAVTGIGKFAFKGATKGLKGITKGADILGTGLLDTVNAAGHLVSAPISAVGSKKEEVKDEDDNRSESSHDSDGQLISVDEKRAKRVERRQLKLATVDRIKVGLDLYADGKIFKAKAYYYKHFDEWIDILGHHNPSIINVKEDLGDIEYAFGNYALAKKYFEGASRAVHFITSGEEDNDSVRLLQKLGRTRDKLQEKEAAAEDFEDAYVMNEKILEFDAANGITSEEEGLYQKAKILFLQGDYKKAKIPLAEIMRRTLNQGLKRNPNYLNMAGMICFAESRYDEARVYFEKAHRGVETRADLTPREKTHILFNLGYAYIHTHQFEEAQHYFRWALEELDHCMLSDFDKKCEQVRILTKTGHAHFYLKELDEAFECYSRAFRIDMSLFNDEKRDTILNLRRYIGLTRCQQKRYDDALYVFEGVLYSQNRQDWPNSVVCGKTLLDMSEIYFIGGSMKLSEIMQLRLSRHFCKRATEIFQAHKLPPTHSYVKQARHLQALIVKDYR